jgi:hypothetical protein
MVAWVNDREISLSLDNDKLQSSERKFDGL